MACKKITTAGATLSELLKRVPKNQLNDFYRFRDKNSQYKRRLSKLPEHLPKIDWDYYRTNVRAEFVKMVDEFEQKYGELSKTFDERENLDTSKYYEELEKLTEETTNDVEKFIEESNERIEKYQAEIERIKGLIPFDQMTAEEYCDLCVGGCVYTCNGRPSFWPHLPEEQMPGPQPVKKTDEELEDEPPSGKGAPKKKKSEKKVASAAAEAKGSAAEVKKDPKEKAAAKDEKAKPAKGQKSAAAATDAKAGEKAKKKETSPKAEAKQDPKTVAPKDKNDPSKGSGKK